VARPNRLEINRPELRLIADSKGPLTPPRWCNLAEPANRAIDIVRIIDAKKHSVDVTGYILSE
jgi:hypothetical protein